MHYSPLLILHICGGTVGLLSGTTAMTFRKGSRWHGMAGNVFFVSMLTMSSAGAYMATVKQQTGNIIGGVLTFYLVATAWRLRGAKTEKPAFSIGLVCSPRWQLELALRPSDSKR